MSILLTFYATNASSKNSCEQSLFSPLILHVIKITTCLKVISSGNLTLSFLYYYFFNLV